MHDRHAQRHAEADSDRQQGTEAVVQQRQPDGGEGDHPAERPDPQHLGRDHCQATPEVVGVVRQKASQEQ